MLKKSRLITAMGLSLALVANVYAEPAATNTVTNPTEVKKADAEVDIKKLSETFGNFIGRNLSSSGFQFDLESIIKGMRDGAAGKPAPMSDQEYEMMMTAVQEKAFSKISEENLKKANQFLEQNNSAEGVKTLEPGKLQYKVLKEGTGETVRENAVPSIQYKGSYLDGTVFGNSEEVGGPIKIPLNQTIPGFSKGILGMKEGEKRRLFVHPELGYGTTGHLPPNSLLIFDVEVIHADSKDAADGESDDEVLPLSISDEEDTDDDEDNESNQR